MGNLLNKFTAYLKETRLEMRKVNWPTRQEATRLTAVVIIVSLAVSVVLGGFDFMFTTLLQLVI